MKPTGLSIFKRVLATTTSVMAGPVACAEFPTREVELAVLFALDENNH